MSKLSFSPFALLAVLPTVACVGADAGSIPETSEEVAAALEQENGGLDTADEAPMFGAEAYFDAAAIESDTAASDPLEPDVTAMETTAGVRVRNVAVLWGQLPADPSTTVVRDWSGRLELNRGGMRIRRIVGFEQAMGDRIVPRTDRAVIEFASRTRPHADGLILTIADPEPGTGPLTLTYTPADGSAAQVLELRELADGPLVVDAGEGNKIIVSARDRDACDHGIMRGRWHELNERGGVYAGMVADQDGLPIGHVRGLWGQRQDGSQVFFGKYIAPDGSFRGILAGTYANGKLAGRWLTRAGEHGRVGGVYFQHDQLRGGGFLARWGEASCSAN